MREERKLHTIADGASPQEERKAGSTLGKHAGAPDERGEEGKGKGGGEKKAGRSGSWRRKVKGKPKEPTGEVEGWKSKN